MSSINNALLASGALKAQPHAVLVASVADGAEEIARLRSALSEVREILTQSEMQCHHPPDDGGDTCDGEDCIFCACMLAIAAALEAK